MVDSSWPVMVRGALLLKELADLIECVLRSSAKDMAHSCSDAFVHALGGEVVFWGLHTDSATTEFLSQ